MIKTNFSNNFLYCIVLLVLIASLIQSAQGHNMCSVDKISVTKTALDGSSMQLAWLNGTGSGVSKYGFMVSTNNTLYRSTDYGKTWINQNSKLAESDQLATNQILTGTPNRGVRGFFISANNGAVIYLMGYDSRIWRSTDKGETWELKKYPGVYFRYLQTHPTNPDWILAVTSPACMLVNTYAASCSVDLVASINRGDVWNTVETYLAYRELPYSNSWWGIGSETRISYLHFVDKTGDVRRKYPHFEDLNFVPRAESETVVLNDFRDKSQGSSVLANSDACLWDGESLFATRTLTNVDNDRYKLYISHDYGTTWVQAIIPLPPDMNPTINSEVYGYYIVDNKDGEIVLIIGRYSLYVGPSGYQEPYYFDADMYIGNHVDGKFAWSTNSIVFEYDLDFVHLDGIPGVFIANQNFTRSTDDYRSEITFDGGSSWEPLIVPTQTSCSDGTGLNCTLHLIGPSGFKSIKSRSNAPGVVIGNGSVGRKMNYANINPYISLDAGLTWKRIVTADNDQILTGSQVFEIADHSSVIGLVDDNTPTEHLAYSIDGGVTFKICEFDTVAQVVLRMFTETSETTENLLLFTVIDNKYYIQHLNFTAAYSRQCVDPVDYEEWTLAGTGEGGNCVLGRRNIYKRRKPGVECYNPNKADSVPDTSVTCQCYREDFACAYCFYLDDSDGTCQFQKNCPDTNHVAKPPANCPVGDTYWTNYTTGYQKVPTSTCTTGLQMDTEPLPRELKCPGPYAPIYSPPSKAPPTPQVLPPTILQPFTPSELEPTGILNFPTSMAFLGMLGVLVFVILFIAGTYWAYTNYKARQYQPQHDEQQMQQQQPRQNKKVDDDNGDDDDDDPELKA